MVQALESQLGSVLAIVLTKGTPARIAPLLLLEFVAVVVDMARYRTVGHEVLHFVVAESQYTELVARVGAVAVAIESNLAHVGWIVLAFFDLELSIESFLVGYGGFRVEQRVDRFVDGCVVVIVVVSAAALGAVGKQVADFIVGEPKQSEIVTVQSLMLGTSQAERTEICQIVLGWLRPAALSRCRCGCRLRLGLNGIAIMEQVKCLLRGCRCRCRRQGGEAEESIRSGWHCFLLCAEDTGKRSQAVE